MDFYRKGKKKKKKKRIDTVGTVKGMTNHRGISEYKVVVSGSSRRSFLSADVNARKEYFRSEDK